MIITGFGHASGSASLVQLKITFDSAFSGATYTVTGNGETYTGTVPTELVVIQKVKSYSTTYTITSTAYDNEYSTTIETGTYSGEYSGTLKSFSATVNITVKASNKAQSGATVTLKGSKSTYTGTTNSSGMASITVHVADTYTPSASYGDYVTASGSAVTVSTDGSTVSGSVSLFGATLTVTADVSGASVSTASTVKVTDGTHVQTASFSVSGSKTFTLYYSGTYTVSMTNGTDTATSTTVAVTTSGGTYSASMSYNMIFGVRWNYGSSSTALTRLTPSNDSVVTNSVSSEPVAAVGTGSGSSPFDSIYPWSDMEEYNVISNAVSYKRGSSGFSRTSYDTVVKIPEFYYKVVQNTSSKTISYYISQTAASGFTKHPGSGRYVGRYTTGSGYVTKSGLAPIVNITRATARTGSANHGGNWWAYDYATWCAVWLLYLVEFADWNSQSKVGRGYVDGNSSAISSGGTDSMTYFTGRAAGTDGKTAVQYRHIENPWGNVYQWVDGINFSGGNVYYCGTPSKFADDTSANYTNIGTKSQANGYISALGYSSTAPWSFYPTANGGSETTYIADEAYYNSGWRVLRVGGYWDDGSDAGLFYFCANYSSSYSYSYIGCRLIFTP